jgi:DNA polymerase I
MKKSGNDWRSSGAYVFEPKAGLYDRVAGLDLASLYPTCICSGNISKETLIPEPKIPSYNKDELFFVPDLDSEEARLDPPIAFWTGEEGILPRVTKDVWEIKKEQGRRKKTAEGEDKQSAEIQYDMSKILLNCFAPDTHVVTPDGIVNIKQLDEGDEVFSLNPETLKVERKDVTETFEYEYDEEMVHIEQTYLDHLVTPNHKFLASRAWKGREDLQFFEASDLCNHKVPNAETVYQGERHHLYTLERPQERSNEEETEEEEEYGSEVPRTYDMNNWLQLMAWFITGGGETIQEPESFEDNERGRAKTIVISQHKEKYRAEIKALLEEMGLSYSDNCGDFKISNAILYDRLVEDCGRTSHEKTFPLWVLELSEPQRRLFFKTLRKGDGDKSAPRYTTSSEELRDRVLALGVSLGFKARYNAEETYYRVWFSDHKGTITNGNDHIQTKDNPFNKVYCVEVEDNHTLYAGRNGKFGWTGNSAYGTSNSPKSRLSGIELGEATVSFGRHIIKQLAKKAQALNYPVVAGDTDSLYLDLDNETPEQIQTLAQELTNFAQHVADDCGAIETNRFQLEPEVIAEPALFVVKKRYALMKTWEEGTWLDKPKLKPKGFYMIRTDCPDYTKEIMRTTLLKLMQHREPPSNVFDDYVNERYVDVRDGNVEPFRVASRKKIKSDLQTYREEEGNGWTYWVAHAAYESNRHFDTCWGAGSRPYLLRLNDKPEEYEANYVALEKGQKIPEAVTIDWEQQAQNTVVEKVTRIFQALDCDDRLEVAGQRSLSEYPASPTDMDTSSLSEETKQKSVAEFL